MKYFLDTLFPDIYIRSVYELPLEQLKSRGIKGLIFDIDNTVAPFDVLDADEYLIEFFKKLREEGFRVCILSNNNKKRVRRFNQKLRALAVHKAGKPGTRKLKKAMVKMQTHADSTAMIGDQVFTDMWCGHRAGLLCIMTAPISERDQLVTKVKRGLERQIMKIYFKKYPLHNKKS